MKLAVLKIRNFRNLWLGQTVSQFGDAVYGLLFLFMTDKITQRPEMVGGVAAVTALPFLVLSPFAGVLADRVDRRRIMVATDVLSAVVLAAFGALLAVNKTPPVWSLFLTPFLLSSVNAFFLPAHGAAVPSVVPPESLISANSLASATRNLMHTVGLMLAALLLGPLEALNPGGFFMAAITVNLATFLVSALFVSRLPALEPRSASGEVTRPLDDLKGGMKLLGQKRVLQYFFASNLVINLAVSGFMVVYTATNRAWFDGKFATLALVELAFLLALVVSSLMVPRFKITRIGLVFAVVLALVGLDVAVMGWARTIPLYILGNVVAGLALPFANIPFMTYLNLSVPAEYRGRLNSFLMMISSGVQPVGSALSGSGIRLVGLVGMYVAMGGAMTAAALAPLASKSFREERMPESGSGEGERPTDPA